ncbi:hypothetical protein B0H14DRAFT_3509808 [Mycena olivaceomarginata]|nr:hypothetical protein B0H14DRAFT_3509808 [Mycena olivaceomarginata]
MQSTLPPPQMNRERRQWTAQEDEFLRMAVNREEPGNPAPSKWHAIAQHVPNRTNKDCRKRWYAKMSSDVVKGGWAPDEDQRLLNAIDTYGTRWSVVASVVQTRNSDQCAKRWCDTLNPAIDRTAWTAEADELLIQAVNKHGKLWTKIVQMYFPGRTGLAAKNRYNSITRSEESSSRRRHSPESSPSPPLELDTSDAYYSSHSRSQSMSQPGQLRGYPSIPHPSQQSGHRTPSGSRSMSGIPGHSRSHSSQLQPPTNPNYHTAQAYYPAATNSSRYPPPRPSQYPGQPPTLPSNNATPVFPDYSLLTQNQYPSSRNNRCNILIPHLTAGILLRCIREARRLPVAPAMHPTPEIG